MTGDGDERDRTVWAWAPLPPAAGRPSRSARRAARRSASRGHGRASRPVPVAPQSAEAGPPASPPPPPASPAEQRRTRLAAHVGIAIVAVLLGGVVALVSAAGDTIRDPDGTIVAPGELAAGDLRIGDCFDDPGDADEVFRLLGVPCDQPHAREVFHEFAHPDGPAPPSDEVATRRIDEECVPAFAAFVGIAYRFSALEFSSFEPTPAGWEQGDRTVQCVLYNRDGSTLTGSARDSRR